jgi:hypothetical protein
MLYKIIHNQRSRTIQNTVWAECKLPSVKPEGACDWWVLKCVLNYQDKETNDYRQPTYTFLSQSFHPSKASDFNNTICNAARHLWLVCQTRVLTFQTYQIDCAPFNLHLTHDG